MFTSQPMEEKVIVQIKERPMLPPPALLSPCVAPFDAPPKTYSEKESAQRDIAWRIAFDTCAAKPDKVKEWYQSKQVDK